MAQREDSRDVDAAAAEWAARLDRGVLTEAQERALRDWQASDPRHRGALLRAQAIAMLSQAEHLVDPANAKPTVPIPRRRLLTRRRMLASGGGLAVAAAAGSALLMSAPAAGAVVATARGEIRLVPLADGSTVLLNTDTRVRISYDERERRVTLLGGEAFFSITADRHRPFVVDAGRGNVTATVAQFRVSRLPAMPIDVLVHQGRVAVDDPGRGRKVVVLDANTQVTLSDEAGADAAHAPPRTVSPDAVTRALAWRDGKLAFEGETLAQAAAAFGRYSDVRLVIADPQMAQEPVAGLFAANDPAGFGTAVARLFHADVVRSGDTIRLTRAKRLPR